MYRKDLFTPYDGEGKYIYVSYSHADSETVYDIITAFHDRGYRLWHDEGIPSGAHFAKHLAKKVEECEAFFCFLSPEYVESDYCARELHFALKKERTVIPIFLKEFKLPDDLEFELSSLYYAFFDKFKSIDEFVDKLANRYAILLDSCRSVEQEPSMVHEVNRPEDIADSMTGWEESAPTRGRGNPLKAVASAAAGVVAAPVVAVGAVVSLVGKALHKKKKSKEENEQAGKERPAKETENPAKETENPAAKQGDKVSFSVLSPLAVKSNSYGTIDLHMYTEAQREVVDRAIRESNGLVKETSKGGFSVRMETSVTARLTSPDIELGDAMETQVWTGDALHFDFMFFVPEDYARTQIAFVCHIEYNGIPVTRLNFLVNVTAEANIDSRAIPTKVIRSDYKKAFISYSRKDEQRMLARVVGITELVPSLIFWLDKQSMDAGDFWREEIRNAISISDVLLLFWSMPASQSVEVEKEWRYGLEQKGLSFIAPVPLDPPEKCPPPEPLQELNFNVRAFSDENIPENLTFYDSNNIIVLG